MTRPRLVKISLEYVKEDGNIIFYEFHNFQQNEKNRDRIHIGDLTPTVVHEMGKDWIQEIPLNHDIMLDVDVHIERVQDYRIGTKEK